MSSQRDMPEPWASAAVKQQLVRGDGNASLTALARKAGVGSVETVRRLVWGVGRPSPGTVEKVASALKIDVTVVSEWAKQRREVVAPYAPPEEAALLTSRQRKALDELIRSMAAAAVPSPAAAAPDGVVTALRGRVQRKQQTQADESEAAMPLTDETQGRWSEEQKADELEAHQGEHSDDA